MSHVVPDQSRLQEEDQASTHVVPDQSRLQEEDQASTHVVPDEPRLQEEDQASTHVVPDEPRLQEKTVPEVGQAQPSRLHYEGLQLYSQPASPDDVWKSLKKLSKGSQIQLKHYRGFVGPYKAYADMSGLEFSLLYLSGLKETDSLLTLAAVHCVWGGWFCHTYCLGNTIALSQTAGLSERPFIMKLGNRSCG